MTKRERVIAAIQQKDIDGIPSGFSLHFPEDKKRGEASVKAHLDFLPGHGYGYMQDHE